MRQLGELKKSEAEFKAAGAEVIAVFREEQQGVQGLQKIKQKTKTPFTLALDLNKAQTKRYSNEGRKEFTGYVIDKSGTVTAIFKGDLKNRAQSNQLLKSIAAAKAASSTPETPTVKPGDPEPASNSTDSAENADLDTTK